VWTAWWLQEEQQDGTDTDGLAGKRYCRTQRTFCHSCHVINGCGLTGCKPCVSADISDVGVTAE